MSSIPLGVVKENTMDGPDAKRLLGRGLRESSEARTDKPCTLWEVRLRAGNVCVGYLFWYERPEPQDVGRYRVEPVKSYFRGERIKLPRRRCVA